MAGASARRGQWSRWSASSFTVAPVTGWLEGSGLELRDGIVCDETLATGRVCYYSRSRGRLWRKGEESGNEQQLREMRIDCDGDVLLLSVEQLGPACHTGRRSCFYLKVDGTRVVVTDAPERHPEEMYRRGD